MIVKPTQVTTRVNYSKLTPPVTIVDRHCGFGKSRALIASLSDDRPVLIVLPLQTEVDRFIKEATVNLIEPSLDAGFSRKRDHLQSLLMDGYSIVTTHALFSDIAYLAQNGLLRGHDVYIDEVLNVVSCVTQEVLTKGSKGSGVSLRSWQELYLEHGFATVDPVTNQVIPTEVWDKKQDLPELSNKLYHMAKAESLFAVGDNVLVWELPPILLRAVKSLTIYTFLAEGSLMAAFLRRNGIEYSHDRDLASEKKFREDTKRLLEIRDMPSINRLTMSYSGQKRMNPKDQNKVSVALKNVRERLMRGADMTKVMITCSKDMWFKDGKYRKPEVDPKEPSRMIQKRQTPGPYAAQSRMFGDTNWVPNTTRGTNDYRHCSHLFYLWDQHQNPRIIEFLGAEGEGLNDKYAVSELIQWLYRSQIRDGKPVTMYMPSKRMRRLVNRWLDGDLELY